MTKRSTQERNITLRETNRENKKWKLRQKLRAN